MRIAVIGAGIAGLGAAWLLGRRHEVTVYERAPRPGGHSNTVVVHDRAGEHAVDTGFIVYNERNYPLLTALFRELGVPTQPSDMSFAASLDGGRIEYSGSGLTALFAQPSNLFDRAHWRMLREIVRFNREARAARDETALESMTLAAFLARGGYAPELAERYLLPMAAAIWSCPVETMRGFPAASFIRFFDNHGLLDLKGRPQWRTVVDGSRTYVNRLAAATDQRLDRAVVAVTRRDDSIEVRDVTGASARFDQVVMATHADTTLRLLTDTDAAEASTLGAFRFQRNLAVLHTDARLMPRRRATWSSWNYVSGEADRVAVTYWMNRLQRLTTPVDYFVTLNPPVEPDRARTLRAIEYEHPVFDRDALAAQHRLGALQGRRRTWFCGAWTGYGFHEDGLRSGLEVAAGLGVQWRPLAGEVAGGR